MEAKMVDGAIAAKCFAKKSFHLFNMIESKLQR